MVLIKPVHFIKPFPENISYYNRGLLCRATISNQIRASSYKSQVTCKNCLKIILGLNPMKPEEQQITCSVSNANEKNGSVEYFSNRIKSKNK